MPKDLRIPMGHTSYAEADDSATNTERPRLDWTDVHKRTQNISPTTDIEAASNIPNPLLHSPPILDPLSAMEQLMNDLNFYGPVFHNRAQGKPFDVIGGYKGLQYTQSQCKLSVGTLNVAGLDDYKLDMAILLMLQSSIDVLVLTNTQHTTTSAGYYKKKVQRRLGGSTKLYASDTYPRKNDRRVRAPMPKTSPTAKLRKTPLRPSKRQSPTLKTGPGGVMIIVGPKWGPSLMNGRSDDSGHGTLAEVKLRTQTGFITILGTYWPEKPATTHIH